MSSSVAKKRKGHYTKKNHVEFTSTTLKQGYSPGWPFVLWDADPPVGGHMDDLI